MTIFRWTKTGTSRHPCLLIGHCDKPQWSLSDCCSSPHTVLWVWLLPGALLHLCRPGAQSKVPQCVLPQRPPSYSQTPPTRKCICSISLHAHTYMTHIYPSLLRCVSACENSAIHLHPSPCSWSFGEYSDILCGCVNCNFAVRIKEELDLIQSLNRLWLLTCPMCTREPKNSCKYAHLYWKRNLSHVWKLTISILHQMVIELKPKSKTPLSRESASPVLLW